jgi:hypothetical protein
MGKLLSKSENGGENSMLWHRFGLVYNTQNYHRIVSCGINFMGIFPQIFPEFMDLG